jgi:hypothetical protein
MDARAWLNEVWLVGCLSRGGTASKLQRRVVRAAEAALAERQYVTAIDVLVGVGWHTPRRVDEWRQGRVDYLERVVEAAGEYLGGDEIVSPLGARSRPEAERDQLRSRTREAVGRCGFQSPAIGRSDDRGRVSHTLGLAGAV